MRILALAFFALAAFAQEHEQFRTFIREDKVVCQYSITNNRVLCPNTRYSMVCGLDHPDCNTPDVKRGELKRFDSVRDALDWANSDGAKLRGFEVVSLLETKPVPIYSKTVTTEVPQPAKVETRTKYGLK